jgi:hypothetical protein
LKLVNLEQLQKRLNGDANLRARFFADPVAVLRREGLTLSLEQGRRLRDEVRKQRAKAPSVSGASIRGGMTVLLVPAV